jgi:hypothetical protein
VISISASAFDEFFISTAESALAGIAALVPVGSAPELSHKRTEPQMSGPACGTYLHGVSSERERISWLAVSKILIFSLVR